MCIPLNFNPAVWLILGLGRKLKQKKGHIVMSDLFAVGLIMGKQLKYQQHKCGLQLCSCGSEGDVFVFST